MCDLSRCNSTQQYNHRGILAVVNYARVRIYAATLGHLCFCSCDLRNSQCENREICNTHAALLTRQLNCSCYNHYVSSDATWMSYQRPAKVKDL
ncbi:hypothetical protein J6590_050779 [Homalodisca vitripennis]|nr:hypothetical protein J6590_050779 [Homalodisca vitripennis]